MNFDQLISNLQDLDASLRQHVAQSANIGLTLRNWLVGAYLVEFEQNGEERARYGEGLVPELAKQLKIKGLSPTILRHCRTFYLSYPAIHQSLTGEFSKLLSNKCLEIHQPATGELDSLDQAQASQLITQLSFTHFVELLKLDDPLQRRFYETECVNGGWSVRELKRQIGSLLFERLGLSTDKKKLLRLTASETTALAPADLIKDPYVFEFLGLRPKEVFREHDLETALLDHLQEFLLELGTGFCFEDRQKNIRIGSTDYFVDLVFYHRKLHCHVLIELKVEPFNHANAGQLNTYVNYYRKHEMAAGDNPPVGLLLCTNKDQSLVEYALGGMDKNLFVSSYKIALPSRAELEHFLHQQTSTFGSS